MFYTNHSYWKLQLTFALTLALISCPGSSLQIQAQIAPSPISTVQFNRPILSSRGSPGDRKGGGTRDGNNCPALKIQEDLMALVPEFKDTQQVTHVLGLTQQESPTLWFYVPYSAQDVEVGALEIWDETQPSPRNYQQIYKGTFTLAETPGIIRLNLPAEVKLEPSKNYHWYLSLAMNCTTQDVSVNANGWIQRVEGISSPSEQLSPREQALLYAQKGIWQDTLTLLAQRYSENSTNPTVAADWEQLLSEVDLQELVGKPLVPCCTLQNAMK